MSHIGKLRFGTTNDEEKSWSSWLLVFSSSLESRQLHGREPTGSLRLGVAVFPAAG